MSEIAKAIARAMRGEPLEKPRPRPEDTIAWHVREAMLRSLPEPPTESREETPQ